jgi:hypothetical protein
MRGCSLLAHFFADWIRFPRSPYPQRGNRQRAIDQLNDSYDIHLESHPSPLPRLPKLQRRQESLVDSLRRVLCLSKHLLGIRLRAEVPPLGVRGRGLALLLSLSFATQAQFGNEWINFSQQYYKIPVTQNGIYRLTYNDLSTAGVPVNTIDPRRIQIFRRGVEQSINFHNLQIPANGVFESGEYLEFYGERNNGATDVDLYKNPAHHPHTYMNLYSDTASYFLTWQLLPVQGKRMTVLNPEVNVGNLPPETGFTNTVMSVLYNQYSGGETYGGRVQSSFFDEGEGWTGTVLCNTGCSDVQDMALNLPGGVTTAAVPQLEVLLAGRIEGSHFVEIYAGQSLASLRLVGTASFTNFQNAKVNFNLLWTDVAASGNISIRAKAVGVGGTKERVSVSYAKLDYIRNFNFSGITNQIIQTLPNAGNKSYIEIQNPPSGLRLFDVTDITNASIIGTTANTNLEAIVNGTIASRKIFASSTFITPTLRKVSFRSITPASHNYLIISNKTLRKPGLGYSDPVKAYGTYRASVAGGDYDTLVVNIDQLYNQFNYGETSPRAIYQFLKFMANGGNPKYLFIIGKGLDIHFAYDRNRIFQPMDYKDLVPSAGYPGSDFPFSAGLNGTTYEHAIATGRLTAVTPAEVAAYLNKIIETEAQPFDNLWKKNVLHLSGGINPGEPQAFRYYVDGFKVVAEDIYYGANVTTQGKQTLEPDEQVNIAPKINEGVSLVTSFGHASSSAIDLDIGSINNPDFGYNNAGKYPAFLVNGCNIGAIYANGRAFPEDWMVAQNKGAKAFIAHVSFGYETTLRFYSDLFYHFAFSDSSYLDAGIGDIQVLVADSILRFGGAATYNVSIMQQMALMGDPAVRIFGATKPDYAIENSFLSKVSFDGKPVTAATPAFGIQYKIRNYGQARTDSIRVTLTRTFPDNSVVVYDTVVPPVHYEESFVFLIENPPNTGGANSFVLKIDDPNELWELSESNNTAILSLFIPSSATYNLVPYPNAIVSSTLTELVFQNTNQSPAYRLFELELDTVPEFNSNFLKQYSRNANVLVRQDVTLANHDSTVYYWRSRLAQPTANESAEWFTSSFMYIANGSNGWSQGRHQQLGENTFSNLELNPQGELKFIETISNVFVQNFGSANTNAFTNTSFQVDGQEYNISTFGQTCRNNTINLVAFNKTAGVPYAAIALDVLDARNCGREPQVIMNFTQAEAQAASNGMAQAITNLAVNDSVVLFTIGNPNVPGWSAGLLTALEGIGLSSTQLTGFQVGEPLIIFGRKGAAPGSARVIRTTFSPANAQELVVNETITARADAGSMTSPEIGPAKSWLSLSRNIQALDATDEFEIEVIGITEQNDENVLYQGSDNPVSLGFISPFTYPKIKLRLVVSDPVNLTPVDWDSWHVAYQPVAEGILLSRSGFGPIEKYEGETWNAKYAFINVTQYSFPFGGEGETLNATFDIDHQETGEHHNQALTIDAPAANDSTLFEIPVPTIGLGGLNSITAIVNTQQAREQYFFNDNLPIENYLSVVRDGQAPVLDVSVDGRYLANGDVVSPDPVVNITLMDENQFWFKADTAGVVINFKNLDTDEVRRINFSDPETEWTAASASADFKVSFVTHLEPGQYELRVSAQDASGNLAGEQPYSVEFYVTDMVGFVIGNPFPNPTYNTVSFPVRISGNDLPSALVLKIISPDGRLVGNFDLNDVSGLYIGTNYIHLKMDDLEGGSLPAGVYFYKLEIRGPGQSKTSAGQLIYIRN